MVLYLKTIRGVSFFMFIYKQACYERMKSILLWRFTYKYFRRHAYYRSLSLLSKVVVFISPVSMPSFSHFMRCLLVP